MNSQQPIIDFDGEAPRAHDAVIMREGDDFYLFSTGRGVSVRRSTNFQHWGSRESVLSEPPAWCEQLVPGNRGFFWAPDIAFFGGRWHLYYSVSTFGSNRSAIGLATNVTLDSQHSNYEWRDEGMVCQSHREDGWNAIDPNVLFDAQGRLWMALGSFWDGIKLRRLDEITGKLSDEDTTLHSLARRPRTPEIQGSVEAPFIVRRGEFYILFVSFDFCCRGVDSTYNIRVGRARDITGPYLDRDGTALLEGGGTLVRQSDARWRGPGHNSVFHDRNGADWLIYHAYDAENGGASRLRVEKLGWDEDGWPFVA
ncbi:MAG: arabinan endo-1,5-alpha-L-arabinosidase, partial [Armatimonadetes bacterium]|nr:arabinan endo-1,5-alpha-L-arabinosidase [Armatimonadota bacterium]